VSLTTASDLPLLARFVFGLTLQASDARKLLMGIYLEERLTAKITADTIIKQLHNYKQDSYSGDGAGSVRGINTVDY